MEQIRHVILVRAAGFYRDVALVVELAVVRAAKPLQVVAAPPATIDGIRHEIEVVVVVAVVVAPA
jgi:hypothetical protein